MKSNRGGRPRSPFRQTVHDVVRDLVDERGPVCCREIAERVPGINTASPAERQLVETTINNMQRAGELETVGSKRVPGSCKPVSLFVLGRVRPADLVERDRMNSGAALAELLRAWQD
ncbi:MAG: hypothetical protein IPG93_10885 [Burkholderiales bacterium]|nr:hypothetical protein [Burkholderiales bacterium]